MAEISIKSDTIPPLEEWHIDLQTAVCRFSYFIVSEACAGVGGIVMRGCTSSLLGSYVHQELI